MRKIEICGLVILLVFGWSCGSSPTANNTPGNVSATPEAAKDTITVVERPQKIRDQMKARGQQDEAKVALKIVSPTANSTVISSTVKIKLLIGGDLKNYKPMMDEATHTGNHIHVILDNQPYEAYYNLDQLFELRNVADGPHTLRVFPSRPWHESYKNEGAFQMIRFTVKKGGADANRPVTTNSGQPMSNSNAAVKREGKDMQESTAGPVDPNKPLLTFSRPKGEYKGADADAIMIDFWLTSAKLAAEGGDYRVRYSIDGGEPRFIDKWWPIWLSGITPGNHSINLELIDKDGNLVDNGGYNSTTREITVTK